MAKLQNFPRLFEEENPENGKIDDRILEELGKVKLFYDGNEVILVVCRVTDDLYGIYCLHKRGTMVPGLNQEFDGPVNVGGLRMKQYNGEEGVEVAMSGIYGTIEKLLKLPSVPHYVYVDLHTPEGAKH